MKLLLFNQYDRLLAKFKAIASECRSCFFGAFPHRPDENGSVRQSWAFGRWADADSLRYIPINETMEVKREDYEGEFG